MAWAERSELGDWKAWTRWKGRVEGRMEVAGRMVWGAELGDLLKDLVRQGRTLVVATHDEEFARGCATRVIRVSDGAVFEER